MIEKNEPGGQQRNDESAGRTNEDREKKTGW